MSLKSAISDTKFFELIADNYSLDLPNKCWTRILNSIKMRRDDLRDQQYNPSMTSDIDHPIIWKALHNINPFIYFQYLLPHRLSEMSRCFTEGGTIPSTRSMISGFVRHLTVRCTRPVLFSQHLCKASLISSPCAFQD